MDEKIVVESKILFASPNCCIISLPYVQVDHDHMCVCVHVGLSILTIDSVIVVIIKFYTNSFSFF